MSEPSQHDESAPPLLSVAALARRLGVAPATLRTWDRRYGLGPTGHAPGAHRRYRPADVRRLGAMRELTLRGMPAADAARAVLAGQPVGDRWVDSAESVGDGPPRRRGGGTSLALPGAGDDVRGLAAAAMALDQAAVFAMLLAAIRRCGAARTWQDLIRPVLVAVGQRWQATGVGVEVEHLLTAAAITVFAESAVAPEPAHGRPILLGAAPDEMHDLPLHALAATLGEHGVGVRMLGARVPAEALAAAVRRTGPCAVVVYALLPQHAPPEVLERIPVTRPAASVFAAGGGWSAAALPGRVRAVDDINVARQLIMAAAGLYPSG